MTTTFKIVDGDVVLDRRSGRPVLLADKEKLRQDIGEALSVETQPSGFGAGLIEIVGSTMTAFALQAEIGRRAQSAIRAMQILQQQRHWDQRPDDERILGIAQISSNRVTDQKTGDLSKTDFVFKVDVVTVAGSTVSITGGGS